MAAADRYEKIAPLDPRPPILFIRRFKDDRLEVEQGLKWLRRVTYLLASGPIVWIAWLIGGPRDFTIRLFYIIADQLWRVGPVLGIGEPDSSAPGGIVVEYLQQSTGQGNNTRDDSWKEAVSSRIEKSSWVILLLGSGPNVAWEVGEVLARRQNKMAILFRPTTLDNVNMWYDLQESLPSSVGLPALTSDQVQKAIALLPTPVGWTLLTGRVRREAEYRVACSLVSATLGAQESKLSDSAKHEGPTLVDGADGPSLS